jgi:hypothetical protein
MGGPYPISYHRIRSQRTIHAGRKNQLPAWMRKWILVICFSLAGLALVAAVGLYALRGRIHNLIRERTQEALKTHFESDLTFSDFDVSLWPSVHAEISHIVMHYKGRTDIPPLFEVDRADVSMHLLSLLTPKPHVTLVVLTGLKIHVPPRQPGSDPMIQKTDQDLAKKYPAQIDEVRADDAIIVVLRSNSDKPSRDFPIHRLVLRNLSFEQPADFSANLENAVPKGEITAGGQFGPWLPEEPSETHADGHFSFENADLGTLKGISGILNSTGDFNGPLDYLSVNGSADVPNFSLRTADHPVDLKVEYSAVADGTNGDTYLKGVTAHFLHTTLYVQGKVVDVYPKVRGRTIVLEANAQDARVEDLIRISTRGSDTVMKGSAQLHADILMPEGNSDLLDRMHLSGKFGIYDAKFTKADVQDKVDTLSRKGQGEPNDLDISDVMSELRGNFHVENAVADFSNLSFDVPGASVQLAGTFGLDDQVMDFHGQLRLKAKPSQTTTGIKSFFLKAVDPFLKGKDAGTVLAIRISGTKDHVSFGRDHGDKHASVAAVSPPKGH